MTTATYQAAEFELTTLIGIVWRRKYLVAGIAALCVLGAIAVALTSKPVYRAEVVVTEAPDLANGGGGSALAGKLGGLASIAGVNLGQASNGNSVDARAVLLSRHLVEEFVERNNLIPELYPDSKTPVSLWRAVERFRTNVLSIYEDKLNGTISIQIDWSDQAAAARWASGFVALANELLRVRAIKDSERSVAYLNEQIAKTSIVELRAVLYGLIENETKTLMLANGREEYAFTTVDPAVAPEERIRPKRTIIAAIGAVVGFLIGVAAAFFAERRVFWPVADT